jgi:hypothetical protein
MLGRNDFEDVARRIATYATLRLLSREETEMYVEHRSAPACEPLWLELVPGKDGFSAHLEVSTEPDDEDHHLPLPEAIRRVLTDAEAPLTRTALRTRLRVNNQNLGDALAILERRHLVRRTAGGWVIAIASTPSTAVTTGCHLRCNEVCRWERNATPLSVTTNHNTLHLPHNFNLHLRRQRAIISR